MDIGTAKPSAAEQAEVRHHLIDVVEPHDDYTVSRFVGDVERVAREIADRGGVAVLVGGTGLYLQAIVDDLEIPGQFADARLSIEAEPSTERLHARLAELDPVAASRMEPTNRRRIVRALEVTVGSGRPFSSYGPGLDRYAPSPVHQVGCDRPRETLDRRIDRRYELQMEQGFLDEVRSLAASPAGLCRTARQALGYKELLDHLAGVSTLDEALDLARRRTRRFARRQQRWFRRDPRIEWFDLDALPTDACVQRCLDVIESAPARG
jgi:tRNA dimethylallyltransferase